MDREILGTISGIGHALWADTQRCERAVAESVAAVSTLRLPPDRALEKVTQALLRQASHDGVGTVASAIQNPFFRLSLEERFVLAALHWGRLSYDRIARVLGQSVEDISRLAWRARLRLAFAPESRSRLKSPTGSQRGGTHCPEYDPAMPWTQKFMDEEFSSRDRIFLQNHLMACGRCREALKGCREIYYAVERWIPRSGEENARGLDRLAAAVTPEPMTFSRSLSLFVQRRDVQWVLALAGALTLFKMFLGK